jgi:hypothetical protein
MQFTVTGQSSSRLVELRKYVVSGPLTDLYFLSGAPEDGDGLNPNESVTGATASTLTYYIGGITYVDQIVEDTTTTFFSFESSGCSDPNNFVDLPILKDESKQNIVAKPEVGSDVFIIRESLSVFENHYRLRSVGSLAELEFYAGGRNFNIVNNT